MSSLASHIEKINDHFHVPISFNEHKVSINETIILDLELVDTIDPSGTPIYHYAFNPKTSLGKKVVEQCVKFYTTDTAYLEDTQSLMRTYQPTLLTDNQQKQGSDHILSLWDEIRNDTGFKEKYQYIDWSFWEFLNHHPLFLQILSIYSLSTPVISFIVPFIMLIIPFFILRIKGISITMTEYWEVLQVIASNHAIGKLFISFNSVPLDQKAYLVVSAAFYVFSIYQNILTCVRFHENMKKIHLYLDAFKSYIELTELKATNFLTYSSDLLSYGPFNQQLTEHISRLTEIKKQIAVISPYKMSFGKVGELGQILKLFYDIYCNDDYNTAFLYSFGFNGYLDAFEGLIDHVGAGHVNFASFSGETETEQKTDKNKKDKSKKDKNKNRKDKNKKDKNKAPKTSTVQLEESYYPALIGSNPVKNTIDLAGNMVVTGPNASGKTTILKASLINIILSQQFGCGFYKSAQLVPFHHIHCYLNIPDTSGRDSLFQAEARRCKQILDLVHLNPKDRHFCVFDELYSGTNPDEAVSSASAFMNYIAKYDGVTSMLTTHFFKLCKNLEKNDLFFNVHMDTVADKKTGCFAYSYRLKEGISVIRGGIKVLKDMNYPDEIIANSKDF
jgi:hypothetical protein